MRGNPCDKWPGYRDFVIDSLPALVNLDGTEVTRTDRLEAKAKRKDLDQVHVRRHATARVVPRKPPACSLR